MFDSLTVYQGLLEIVLGSIKELMFKVFFEIFLLGNISKFIFSQNIFTSLAIIISALTLAANLSKDREMRRRGKADEIRDSAASTMAKLDRWHELSRSIFQDVQPIFIEVIMAMSEDYKPEKIKNILWKEMTNANNKITWKILDENIENPSSRLMGNKPDIRKEFKTTFHKLQAIRRKIFYNFINEAQRDVLSFLKIPKEEYRPNDLWDKLAGTIERNELKFEEEIEPIFDNMSNRLLGLVSMDDDTLLGE